jgi:hypothetical protein
MLAECCPLEENKPKLLNLGTYNWYLFIGAGEGERDSPFPREIKRLKNISHFRI